MPVCGRTGCGRGGRGHARGGRERAWSVTSRPSSPFAPSAGIIIVCMICGARRKYLAEKLGYGETEALASVYLSKSWRPVGSLRCLIGCTR